ncbi:MAG: hypothetical protein DI598_12600 [Pseudopedobacter saltans]|uniref:Uncharacterized protein n=1 Tax=Pseudopedobacter saltans TaxID=151895 RepID=A0A2W5GS02_9SPHI|nr:MAG: hypothetical protein DI598_12600 [Pseudopedobacter saltans]
MNIQNLSIDDLISMGKIILLIIKCIAIIKKSKASFKKNINSIVTYKVDNTKCIKRANSAKGKSKLTDKKIVIFIQLFGTHLISIYIIHSRKN